MGSGVFRHQPTVTTSAAGAQQSGHDAKRRRGREQGRAHGKVVRGSLRQRDGTDCFYPRVLLDFGVSLSCASQRTAAGATRRGTRRR